VESELAKIGIVPKAIESLVAKLNAKHYPKMSLGEDFVRLMSTPSAPLKLDNFHMQQRLMLPITNALTAPFSRMLSLALFTMVDSDVEAAKARMRASGETEENISYEATCNAIKFAAKHGIRRVSGKPHSDHRSDQFERVAEVCALFIDLADTKTGLPLFNSKEPESTLIF
jgi:hypothetical protein